MFDLGYYNLTLLWVKRNESESHVSEETPSSSAEDADLQTNANPEQ